LRIAIVLLLAMIATLELPLRIFIATCKYAAHEPHYQNLGFSRG
jgi:hypothetical protein